MKQLLKKMDFEYFGTGKHKTNVERFLGTNNALLLDVRSNEESSAVSLSMESFDNICHLQIPINELPDRINEVPKDKFIAVFCPQSVRATMAFMYLLMNGYENVVILEGGYTAITEAIKPGKLFKALNGAN